MPKKCIVDTSSAILLFKVGLFEKLLNHYTIVCPPAVLSELTSKSHYPGARFFNQWAENKEISIKKPEQWPEQSVQKRNDGLGPGEAECITLYQQKEGDFILLDDRRGSAFCKKENIPYINALLVPKILYLAGYMQEEEYIKFFSQLLEKGRYSEKISKYAGILQLSDLLLFLPLDD